MGRSAGPDELPPRHLRAGCEVGAGIGSGFRRPGPSVVPIGPVARGVVWQTVADSTSVASSSVYSLPLEANRHEPQTRPRRPATLSDRPRLHGYERGLRRACGPRRAGVDRDDPPRARHRRKLPLHLRHLRSAPERAVGWSWPARPALAGEALVLVWPRRRTRAGEEAAHRCTARIRARIVRR